MESNANQKQKTKPKWIAAFGNYFKNLPKKKWINFGIAAALVLTTITAVSVYFTHKSREKAIAEHEFDKLVFSVGDMNESLDGSGPNEQKIKEFKDSHFASDFTGKNYSSKYWTEVFEPVGEKGESFSLQDLMSQDFILVDKNNKPFVHYAYELLEKNSIEFTSFANDAKGLLILRLKANTKDTKDVFVNGQKITQKVTIEKFYVIDGFKKKQSTTEPIEFRFLIPNRYHRFLRPNDSGEWVKNKEDFLAKVNAFSEKEKKDEVDDLFENWESNNIFLFKNLVIENDNLYAVVDYDKVVKSYDLKTLNGKQILDEKIDKKEFRDQRIPIDKEFFDSNNDFQTIKAVFKDTEDVDKLLLPSEIKKEDLEYKDGKPNPITSNTSKIYLTGNVDKFNISFLSKTYEANNDNGTLKFSVLLIDKTRNFTWEYRFEDKTRFKSKLEEEIKTDLINKVKVRVKEDFKATLAKYTWEQIIANKASDGKKIFKTSQDEKATLEDMMWDISLMLEMVIENKEKPGEYIVYSNKNGDIKLINFDAKSDIPVFDKVTLKLKVQISSTLKTNSKRTYVSPAIEVM
ncbi:Uncharacterised protein [Mycoplasmopsis californica]|uniref:Lipoprotein 17-related variable surface protein n=1 Tax=Mycoplasmopsis equigenitalium TaxID=114883 RepID=A0ABY5J1C5_9BACT|nr:lipoprotein 17-related variable surface protein [Mycoplasmopsis equigenitalium]UUD37049.1 lipoprotein 17-related variable surface protein [Mycoplasmopsis equigenitalium]VEU69651.1 Uncharacterised protein [Mycoplasmopsis californica]